MFHFYFWKKERRCQFCCQWTGSSDNLSFSRDRACYVLSANYLFCLLVFSSSCLLVFLFSCFLVFLFSCLFVFFVFLSFQEDQVEIFHSWEAVPVTCYLPTVLFVFLYFVFCLLSFQEDRVTIFHSWEIMPFYLPSVFVCLCFAFFLSVFFYFYLFKRIAWQFFILGGSSPLPFLCQVIM